MVRLTAAPWGARARCALGSGSMSRTQRGGAVAERSVVGVVDGAADLDLVAGVQARTGGRRRDASVAELAVLVADRLGAGVQLVEVVVRGLGEHDRRSPARRSAWAASSAASSARVRLGAMWTRPRAASRGSLVRGGRRGTAAGRGDRRGRGRGRCASAPRRLASAGCWLEVGPQSAGADGLGSGAGRRPRSTARPRSRPRRTARCCSRVEASAASSWIIVVRGRAASRPVRIAVWSAACEYAGALDAGGGELARRVARRRARRCW